MNTTDKTPDPWWKKIMWLVVIWSGSVAALFVVSLLLKGFMNAAGLHS